MLVSFEQLVDLIELLIIIIAMFWMYRSIPSDKVKELLDKAESYSLRTPTKLDDLAVQVGRYLANLQQAEKAPTVEITESDKTTIS